MIKEPQNPLEEALAVALDHAYDSNRYSSELTAQVAQICGKLKILTPWMYEGNSFSPEVRRTLSGRVVLTVYHVQGGYIPKQLFPSEPMELGPLLPSRSAARDWCDEQAIYLGWALMPKLEGG